MDRIVSWMSRHPVLLVLGALAVAAGSIAQIYDFGAGALRLRVDPSVNRLLPDDDPRRRFYDEVRRTFGNDETLILVVSDEALFTPAKLAEIDRVSERIEDLDGVDRVMSLSTAPDLRAEGDDLDIAPFLDELPTSLAEAQALGRRVLDNPLYARNLVSEDLRATALFVYFHEMTEREFSDRGLDLQIQALAREETGGSTVWMTGPPRLKAETSRVMISDLARVVPLAFVISLGVAWLSFRSFAAVLIPATTILLALITMLGAMAAAGRTLNLVTTVAPPLLLSIGFAYTVHVISDYQDALREGGDGDPVSRALRHVALPVFLTALTTCVGFLSLAVSPIGAIREFGVFTSVGVAATVFFSLTFAPALLWLLRPSLAGTEHPEQEGRLERWADALAGFDLRHRRWILLAGAASAVLALWGVTRLQVGNDLLNNFKEDSSVRSDFGAVNAALQGANAFYVVLEAERRDAFKEPENLRVLEELQQWLEDQPLIGGTTSLADHVRLLNRSFHEEDPAHDRIPDSEALVTQLLFFGASEETERFRDTPHRSAVILARARDFDSQALNELVDRLEERLTALPGHLSGSVTGNSVLVARTLDDIARGQAESLTLAFAVIYAILALLFTSLRVGLVALIPNALPVAVYFGSLGLAGVHLGPVTALGACIVLGIAVDDSIHYISRFNAESRRLIDPEAATRAALKGVGRPVTYTTAALCLGFLTLTQTQLNTQIQLGAVAAWTLFFAWLVDVTFTPALCSGLRIATLWDLLTLNLGPDPQHAIPLFRGMRRWEARMVAALTRIEEIPAGRRVCSAGDSGHEIFAVIEGELRASLERQHGREELSKMGRGDVFGEVAPFHGRRTADVDAASDARLLALDLEGLERVRRRHPWIGAKLYRNLTRILADRVAQTTERLR